MFPAKVVFMVSVLAYADVVLFVTVCFSSYLTPATATDSPSLKGGSIASANTQVTVVGGEEMELHVMLEDALSNL